MKETNLIEEDPGSEPIMNNAPVIVNEVDINSLIYTSKQTLDRETSLECRMNKLITYGVKEISYKCPNCPDNMKHLCLYCLETCHKSHINNLPSYLFKSDMIDFQKHPCECAKFHHKTKLIQKVEEKDNENKMNCPFNKLFALIKPKYYYKRKDNNKIYCLYCINNFAVPQTSTINEEKENSSSMKDSKLSAFGNMLRKSIEVLESEEKKTNAEKENVYEDSAFYNKYDKFEVDYSQPFPQCECVDDLHRHQIMSENIENLCTYMTNVIDKNRINLDKLAYQILNNDVLVEIFFQKFLEISETIYNSVKDIEEIFPSAYGSIADESNFTQIDLDDKIDWEMYHKATKLIELASQRLKIFNFFGISWINEKYQKFFSYDLLSRLLQCKSNMESNFFRFQLFATKIYRRSTFKNIPHILLINENMSFMNRQLFCSMATEKTENTFNQGYMIVEKIFYLLDFLIDNQNIRKEDYNDFFCEALKIIKAIIPFKSNDVTSVMNVYRKIENNINIIKTKKENKIKIISTLEKIVEKIFSYFNDNKFAHSVKDSEVAIKYDYSFLSSCPLNKELLSTLFNFEDVQINEMTPYIKSYTFYDNLLAENDLYAENIENFLNADKNWRMQINKDFCYIFHGADSIPEIFEVKKFFEDFVTGAKNLMKNEIQELQFLNESNILLQNLLLFLQTRDINFKSQANFFQNKYFINFIFVIAFIERTSTFAKNTETENSKEREDIDYLSRQIFENINQILLVLTQDNPMTASLLFNRIMISLLIKNDFNELNIYINVLKMMKRYNCKINTYFLASHVHNIFKERMILKNDNIKNLATLLSLYKIILKISSDNSMLKVNNIIASDLRFITNRQEYIETFEKTDQLDKLKIIQNIYKCIHYLQNEYFYIINQYIDIVSIIKKLKRKNLLLSTRKILSKIYTDYFVKNYFSTITITKYFQNENLIISNLVENLSGSLEQKQLQNYLNPNENKSQITESEDDKMDKILEPIYFNIQHFKYFAVTYPLTFNKDFKTAVSFFKYLVLYPTVYSIYKFTYFPKSLTPTQKYHLYKLISLYHYAFNDFLEYIVPKFDLEEKDNKEIWLNLFVEDVDIEELKKNLNSSIELLKIKTEKNLDLNFLFNNFKKNSQCFNFIKQNFFEKKEEEKKDNEEKEEDIKYSSSFYHLSSDMNLFEKIQKELNVYKELKADYEGNNVFSDIFEDEHLEIVQKKIVIDLLFKLYFKKSRKIYMKQEDIGYIFQKNIMKGNDILQDQKKISLFSGIYKGRRGAKSSFDPNFNDKTEKYGEFYNAYLSPFLEEKSLYFEIVDKCFKTNPSLWQELFVSMGENSRDLIYNIIMKQLPFLLQFIFIEFNKIDTKETKFYQYFLNVLEFLRLLCEDHNPFFQTMLINYEKAIGKVSLLTHDKSLFIPFISKIPVFVLSNIKHNNSNGLIFSYFLKKDVEYFQPLIEKITDFLIEIIQGTYPENFNDLIKSVDEMSDFGLIGYIKKNERYLDYLDRDISYQSYITYFFKFFNCFVEEGANPLSIKVSIMNYFGPKQLLNISINCFKSCIYKYVSKTITEGVSDELIQVFIKDYDTVMNDTSFSLFLTLFLYIKRANSFQDKSLGDKYKKILDNLKETMNDREAAKNPKLLLMKEYYKFCSTLTLETEIFFVKENSKDDKELFKYSDFFNSKYLKEVVDVRNKNFGKIQEIEQVFFLVHPDSLYLKPFDIDIFLKKAVYENFNTKLTSLLDYYPEVNQLIEMRKTLSKKMLALSQINYYKMEWINAIWAIITNLCFAFGSQDSITYVMMLLSAFGHIICLSLLVLNWFIFECIKKSKIKDFHFSIFFYIKLIFFSLFNTEILPFIWTLLFGVLGILTEETHFLFSLQLFPIFSLFEIMWTIPDSISSRYQQFLSVFFLIIILILFFSSIAYNYFNYDEENNRIYTSYLSSFSYLMNSGLRNGGLPFQIKISSQEGYLREFVFNWMFYLIFNLFILNIVGGIIIDKFDELKQEKKKLSEDKENSCFICSLNRVKFEIKGIDFEGHLSSEHNIANYFHYLMRINRTDEHDLNSIDLQVFKAFKERKINFFPIKKAKSLEEE